MKIEPGNSMTNHQWVERKNKATPRGVAVKCDFYAERALNAEVWDVEGRRYIDFVSGVSVNNVGHRHPRVVKAIEDQLQNVIHTAFQITPYGSYVSLAERINALVPGDFAKKTTFLTTGAEAVENAVKIARIATKRPGIVAFDGAFHGRTLLGMALTGKVAPYRPGAGPMPGSVYHVPFPSGPRGVTAEASLTALKNLFKVEVDPTEVAAIIFEPVQGEGGFVPAPPEFVKALRSICDRHGILLIADEIQSGFGRTGKLFAMEHFDVAADLTTMAKSIAGGVPLSAVCGRAEVMDAPGPGSLGGTYAGNALAIAAAHAVLDIMEAERLPERAWRLGQVLRDTLERLKTDVPEVAEVRGIGSMIGIEFFKRDGSGPDAEFTKKVQARAQTDGLLILICGLNANVIRFLHPLTIEESLFKEGLTVFCSAVAAVSRESRQ